MACDLSCMRTTHTQETRVEAATGQSQPPAEDSTHILWAPSAPSQFSLGLCVNHEAGGARLPPHHKHTF